MRDRQRKRLRPLVGHHADHRLQHRGGELEGQRDQPDLAEIEMVGLSFRIGYIAGTSDWFMSLSRWQTLSDTRIAKVVRFSGGPDGRDRRGNRRLRRDRRNLRGGYRILAQSVDPHVHGGRIRNYAQARQS